MHRHRERVPKGRSSNRQQGRKSVSKSGEGKLAQDWTEPQVTSQLASTFGAQKLVRGNLGTNSSSCPKYFNTKEQFVAIVVGAIIFVTQHTKITQFGQICGREFLHVPSLS